MRYVLIAAIVAGFGVVGGAEPKDPAYTSKTFQDILGRVITRDKDTDAILLVKRKEDAPAAPYPYSLRFSIRADQEGNGNVDIVIHGDVKWDKTYERYFLKADDAIRKELGNQKKLEAAKEMAHKKYVEEQTKRIHELTGGKLKYGMSREQVEAVMGKPSRFEDAQASFGLFYPGMVLWFSNSGEGLDDVRLTKKDK
jgi:hypothetical protein